MAGFLSQTDRAAHLSRSEPDLKDLDGHFVALRTVERRTEVYTDQLGIRAVHPAKDQHDTWFSTRLDGLARVVGPLEIDFSEFGAQWLLANALATQSQVKNVIRLGPSGCATLSAGRCTSGEWASSTEDSARWDGDNS